MGEIRHIVTAAFVTAAFVTAAFVTAAFVTAAFVTAAFVTAAFVTATFVTAAVVAAAVIVAVISAGLNAARRRSIPATSATAAMLLDMGQVSLAPTSTLAPSLSDLIGFNSLHQLRLALIAKFEVRA